MIDIKDLQKVPEGWQPWIKTIETSHRLVYECENGPMYVKITEYRGYGHCDVSMTAPHGGQHGARRLAEDSLVRTEDIPAAIRTCAAFVGGPCNAWLVDTD